LSQEDEQREVQTYMMIAATLAAGIAAGTDNGLSAESTYNHYANIFHRVLRDGIDPKPLAKGEKPLL
jgi:hypothetical protein